MYITVKQLERGKACPSHINRFRKLFGDRAEVTPENVERADNAGLDIYWLFDHIPLKRFRQIREELFWAVDLRGGFVFDDYTDATALALLTIAAEVDGKGGE